MRAFPTLTLVPLIVILLGIPSAQKPTGYHKVNDAEPPTLYAATFSGCGTSETCTISYEGKFEVASVPDNCCTLLVINGDGMGTDAVLNYEVDLNGEKVLSVRGSRQNLRTHVAVQKENAIKLTIIGESFRHMDITISPDPNSSN